MTTYNHMTDDKLEAHLGMRAQDIIAAHENGDRQALTQARDAYAAALNVYRTR